MSNLQLSTNWKDCTITISNAEKDITIKVSEEEAIEINAMILGEGIDNRIREIFREVYDEQQSEDTEA